MNLDAAVEHMTPVLRRQAWSIVIWVLLVNGGQTQSNPTSGPPIYVVERGTAKVYIFGGAAPSNNRWLTPTIRAAFGESTELWQENPAKPDPPGVNEIDHLGRRETGSLFDDLTQRDASRVVSISKALGMTRQELAPYRPWAAALVLQSHFWPKTLASMKFEDIQGYFQHAAEERHIPIHSEYASFADFPRFFATLSKSAQVQWLSNQLDHMAQPLDTLFEADNSWADGDISALLAAQTKLRTQYPELYAAIEIERNKRWAERIETMLARPGVYFIDVGVMHVMGPDSIVVQVERRGMHVHQL